jgi:transcriptional regulator with XRE-family HTH domain
MNTELTAALADIPTRDLATLTGKSTQSAGNWKRGESLPDPALIPAIAKRIGWPTDRLAGAYVRSAADEGSPPRKPLSKK